jgi:peptidoglycan hydrolase CwlO-like protein
MRIFLLSLLITIIASAGFQANSTAAEPGKVTAEDVKQQTQEAWNAAKDYTLQEKEEYQKRIESQLADLSKKIDELKEKAKIAKDDVAVKLQAQIEALKKQQQVADEKLNELRSSTSKAWDQVKTGADKALEDLKKAYEAARSYFP